jgi:uncharacterized RDD family membrane protein YckC
MKRHPTPEMDEVAGMLDRRAEALIVDGLIVTMVLGIVGYAAGAVFVGGALGGFGAAYVTVQFVVPVGLLSYQTALEAYYGQTPSKCLRGIVVVREDGSSITWGGAVARNLLRIVDVLPAFYIVGLVVGAIRGNSQRLGDVVGNTLVVSTAE